MINEDKYKIITWNINGGASIAGNNYDKKIQSKLVDKALEQNAHLMVFTEFVIMKGVDYLFERLENEGYIWFQVSRTGKNGIIIAVKKELIDFNDNLKKQIWYEKIVYSKFEGCNLLSVTLPLKCGKKLSVIGCRMETGGKESLEEQYNFEGECFKEILIPEVEKMNNSDICIVCGDFNNAMHYGNLEETFESVEKKYWKNGEKLAQYNYNLHVIKDCLYNKGFKLCEKETDVTFKHIHNDHIFIRGIEYEDSGIIPSGNLSDHNLLWSTVKVNTI